MMIAEAMMTRTINIGQSQKLYHIKTQLWKVIEMTWRWIYIYFDNHNIKKLWHMCVKDYFCSYISVNMASRFLLYFTKFSRLNSYYSSLSSQLTLSWPTKYNHNTNKTNICIPFLGNFALVEIGTRHFYFFDDKKLLNGIYGKLHQMFWNVLVFLQLWKWRKQISCLWTKLYFLKKIVKVFCDWEINVI